MASGLPHGGGILLLGVNHVDVQNNRVENNDFFGIGMVDYCLAVLGTDYDCATNPPLVEETAPDFNQVIGNNLADNHGAPPAGPFQGDAADLLQIIIPGTGTNNCFSDNVINNTPPLLPRTIPNPLPACS